jgi:uncharacterized protein (TIGR02996 family)
MNQRKAFLRAILDAPDDMALRLVYADWLDEQDDPADRARAELIRIDRQLDELPDCDPRGEELEQRRKALLEQHRAAWFGELDALVEAIDEFEHGFADHITIRMSKFVKNARAIFAHSPVRRVLFCDRDHRELSGLVRCPELLHVRGASFGDEVYGNAVTYAGARRLAASPYVANLEHLGFVSKRNSRT